MSDKWMMFFNSAMGRILAGGIALGIALGTVNLKDLWGGDSSQKLITDEKAMQLYIERTATDAAQKAVDMNERHWKDWRENTESRIRSLERERRRDTGLSTGDTPLRLESPLSLFGSTNTARATP